MPLSFCTCAALTANGNTPDYDEHEDDDVGDVDEDISSGEEGVIAQFVGQDEHVELGDRTRRLAVVDLDWERIRAVDIFAVRLGLLKC